MRPLILAVAALALASVPLAARAESPEAAHPSAEPFPPEVANTPAPPPPAQPRPPDVANPPAPPPPPEPPAEPPHRVVPPAPPAPPPATESCAAEGLETQTPFTPSGKLRLIDRDLALRLKLFTDRMPNLQEARLFERRGAYVLELTGTRDGMLVRDRSLLTPTEAQALKVQVAERLAQAPEAMFDQGGRVVFISTSALLGLTYWGISTPIAFGFEDFRADVATYMLVAGTSFFLPWALTQDAPVPWSAADLGYQGATRGLLHGFFLSELLGLSSDSALLLPTAFSAGELTGGYFWATGQKLTPGQAHLIGNGQDYGTAMGVLAAEAAGLLDIGGLSSRFTGGFGLGGAALGTVGGALFAPYRGDQTWGDAEVMRLAGVLGAFTGLAIADDVNLFDLNGRATAGIVMLGLTGGYVVGDFLVRGQEFSFGESVLIDLGTVASGALTAGIAFLVVGNQTAQLDKVLLSSAAVGGIAGYGVLHYMLGAGGPFAGATGDGHVSVDLHPEGLLSARLAARPGQAALPLVTLSLR